MSLPLRSLRCPAVSRMALLSVAAPARFLAPAAAATTRTLPSAAKSSSPLCPRLLSTTTSVNGPRRDKLWLKRGEVSYTELKAHTEAPDGSILLLDVREPSETAEGMIPSAVNVPLSEITSSFLNREGGGDFEKKYAFKKPDYCQKIIVYCRSGKRSEQARTDLGKAGWLNVRNYTGSWLDWTSQEKARDDDDD